MWPHPGVTLPFPSFSAFRATPCPSRQCFLLTWGGAPGSTWPASCTLTDFSAFGLKPLFFSLRPSSRGGLVQPRGVYAPDSRALRSPGALCPAAWLTLGWLSSPQLRHDRCNTRLLATPWPHTHKPNTLHGEGRPRRPGCQCPGSGRRPWSSLGPEVPLSASPAVGTARSERRLVTLLTSHRAGRHRPGPSHHPLPPVPSPTLGCRDKVNPAKNFF